MKEHYNENCEALDKAAKEAIRVRLQQLSSATLATWVSEIRRISVPGQPREIVCKTQC
jgi:hypothetical protein